MPNSTVSESGGDESPPNSDSGSSPPPSKNDNSSPPSKNDNSSPPSKNDNSSPPSKNEKSSPPSKDNKSSPPPEDDESSSPPPPLSDDSESPPPPSTTPTPTSSKNSPPPLFSPPPVPAVSSSPSASLNSSSSPSRSNEASPPPPSSSGTPISPPPSSEQSKPPINASSRKPVSHPPDAAFVPPPPPSGQSNVVNPLSPGSKSPSPSELSDNIPSANKNPGSIPRTPTPNTNTESAPVKSSPSSNSEATTSPSGKTDSSSSRSSSIATGHSSAGPIIGVTLAAALLVLVAILFVVVKRKKRRIQALEYRAPPGGSARSEGYYNKHAKVLASASNSSSYYASQQMPSSSSGIISDSNRGYGYQQGTQNPTGLKPCFSYEEMADVTNGFSQENLIGQGGFGCVYKGILPDGREVAVKQLKAGSGQGEREFRAEVDIISRVHHRHLVSLIGYCIAEYHRLLVYEFVSNDTLEHHLHGKGVPVMEWSKRIKVAIGASRGLAYLHEDCHPRIIHRDIKSANILLDNTFEAKVADFGLAKLSNDTHTHVSTRVMGTFGYMAPEYASTGKLTDRSDVYSFGVVLLELITGRKPVDSTQPLGDESLVEWARPLLIDALESGNCEELVDPRLQNNFHKAEMFTMIDAAAACVRHSGPKRPAMVKVARALDRGGEMSDLTNGVKYGQSQAFNSDQYAVDIQKFRRMVFTSTEYESSEHAPSKEYESPGKANSREHLLKWPVDPSSLEHSSSQDSETCAIYNKERGSGLGSSHQNGTRIP